MKYLNQTIKSNCPVCDHESGKILWETTSQSAAQHYLLREKNEVKYQSLVDHIESLWGKKKAKVVSCLKCGLCYSSPFTAGDERFYTLAYDRHSYPKWKWEFQETLDTLKKKEKGFRILEVGAGNGMFIKSILKNLTSKENIFCTEYSSYGLQELKKLGVNCFSDDIRNINFENKFDVICLFQVLEHLDDLDSLFSKLDSLLNQGGDLFIAVPNYKFIEFIEKNDLLLDMPPNHVSRWTEKAFQTIATKFNWSLSCHKEESSNWIANAKLIAIYRFLRLSQNKGTLANFILSKSYPAAVERWLKIGCILLYSFSLLKVLYRLKTQNIGNSQWVHFTK
ncbi:class I SAM-dependent methyltransferase [Phaeodactylibacter xiamenensis]|uniref:class I SAM-dependent methyltransferase n=1 Tax=Phaeodactylibacter xiamenensis TaxID=1524460 RepID=UPI0024AA0230|nr:class I SAM-dependent methyltransferase [Phaeodactylibacter xiamenensis]